MIGMIAADHLAAVAFGAAIMGLFVACWFLPRVVRALARAVIRLARRAPHALALALSWFLRDLVRPAPGRVPAPKLTPRPLPRLLTNVPVVNVTPSLPRLIEVSGRTYEVEPPEDAPNICPWCQGSLADEPAEAIVRCDQPYCRRAAHRRHNEENGGCGAVCSIVRA